MPGSSSSTPKAGPGGDDTWYHTGKHFWSTGIARQRRNAGAAVRCGQARPLEIRLRAQVEAPRKHIIGIPAEQRSSDATLVLPDP
ncbi:hypothetical protein NDU88_004053 [Pleurodeles waltl]|uniref:Uncharacterized protein n=1 Tax=Pleurodeles waltl TaxID=8319 RepID=A0AAV7NIQ8_PLEWA|nr:hypothetical protein NDU88_004053 [Pleurodeles waltl]